MSEVFNIVFISAYFGIFAFLQLVSSTVCFFMARNDEKRSGKNTMSGKSAVIYTLMNKAVWLVFFGCTLFLVAFVLPETMEWDEEAEELVDAGMNWMPVRIGLILAFMGSAATFVLGLTWKRWSKVDSYFPSWNMFVKFYSGLNVFLLASTVFFLLTFLALGISELAFNDSAKWENNLDQPFKIGIMLLLTSTVFGIANLLVYSKSSDAVVPFVKKPEIENG